MIHPHRGDREARSFGVPSASRRAVAVRAGRAARRRRAAAGRRGIDAVRSEPVAARAGRRARRDARRIRYQRFDVVYLCL